MHFSNRHLLIFIIVVGSLLRLWSFWDIPFWHDEFSAIFRSGYWNFGELIEKGVKTDTHPAGIQIFINYWILLIGTKEWVLKLPFILTGIGSIWLVYRIGKMWFNETVGLLSSAFFASVQFTVIYSQMARPYTTGVFFSLLAVLYWSKIIFTPEKKLTKKLVLFTLFGALCAYNHHFSLLFIAVVGIIGIPLVKKTILWKYALSGIGIFLLYIPHLGVFFHQLNKGGVGGETGWLAPPENDFIITFLEYVTHFSPWVVAVCLGIFVFGWMNKSEKKHISNSLIFVALFTIPFLIGFFYSRMDNGTNAILQFSLLIFGFPFLVMSFFGHFKSLSAKTTSILVGLIFLVNISTLIWSRQHYSIYYTSHYEEFFKEMQLTSDQDPSIICVINSDERMTDFVIKKHNITADYIRFGDFENLREFKEFLKKSSSTSDRLFFATYSTHPNEVVPLIKQFYPFVEQKNYAHGESYIFSKTGSQNDKHIISKQTFDAASNGNWNNITAQIDSTIEFGPTFSANIKPLLTHENNWIDIECAVTPDSIISNKLILTATLEKDGESLDWFGKPISEFALDSSKITSGLLSIRLADSKAHVMNDSEIELKVSIWNSGKENYTIEHITIFRRTGNPIIYSWFEEIKPVLAPKK